MLLLSGLVWYEIISCPSGFVMNTGHASAVNHKPVTVVRSCSVVAL